MAMKDVLDMKPKLVAGPACPRCGETMIERVARNGVKAGQAFWGCSQFPQCRGTYPHAIGNEKLRELRDAARRADDDRKRAEADPTNDLDFMSFLEV